MFGTSSSFFRARLVPRFVLLCILLVSSLGGAAEPIDFEKANRFYEEGQFQSAKQAYETQINQGTVSANLFYNLGNAEYRLNQLGRAALQYERALSINPSHRDAQLNLHLVRERTGAPDPLPIWSDTILAKISVNALTLTATLSAWLALFGLTALLIRRSSPFLWIAFVLFSLISIGSVFGLRRKSQQSKLAIITVEQVQARLAPADRAALADQLAGGTQVQVLSERGDWTYCRLPKNLVGWVPSNALESVRLRK